MCEKMDHEKSYIGIAWFSQSADQFKTSTSEKKKKKRKKIL